MLQLLYVCIITCSIGEADKVDSGEPEAKQEVDNQENNQGKQEVEVNDYHSHLDQRAAVVCITVDPQQEQVGVQNEVVSPQSLEGNFKEQATVIESDVHEEPEAFEQLKGRVNRQNHLN